MLAGRVLSISAVIIVIAALAIADEPRDETNVRTKIRLLGGTIEQNSDLPDGAGIGISLAGSPHFNDKFVHLLKAIPNLTRLDLSASKITDEGLKQLADLKGLKELNLYDTRTSRAAMSELREKLPGVWIVDDWMISNLGGWFRRDKEGRILSVTFADSKKMNDVEIRLLQPLKHLELLELQGTLITDRGLKEIEQLKNLWFIHVGRTAITDAGVKEIVSHKAVYGLSLDHTKVTDAGIEHLRKLGDIRELALSGTIITDRALETIAQMTSISDLDLESTLISDAGLKQLVHLEELTTLILKNCKVTDRGLKELKNVKNLLTLNLQGTDITDQGLKELQDFRQLRKVQVGGSKITDSGFDELKNSGWIRQVER